MTDETSGYTPYRDRHTAPQSEVLALGAGMPGDKSVGAALLLTFLFGPFGLFYASAIGGFVMLGVALVVLVATWGLALPFVWFGSMIWGAITLLSRQCRAEAG